MASQLKQEAQKLYDVGDDEDEIEKHSKGMDPTDSEAFDGRPVSWYASRHLHADVTSTERSYLLDLRA